MDFRFRTSLLATALFLCGAAQQDLAVPMHAVGEDGIGERVGFVTISKTAHGLVFSPALEGLQHSHGLHGFHVHERPSCKSGKQDGKRVPALAAGGHYDPEGSGRHGLPWGDGHLGDLPALFVDGDGRAEYPVLAPRLRLEDVRGRALMIHAGSDNHADHPAPLGGGGARIACGVIP